MTNTIQCDIVSSNREIFTGEVTLFVASGTAGELGIYPRHAPLITTLKPGPIQLFVPEGEEITYFASGGILEVMPHLITVLVDNAIRADHLDEAAAKQARDEAERQLRDRSAEMDLAAAEIKLMESLAQLEALHRLQKKTKR